MPRKSIVCIFFILATVFFLIVKGGGYKGHLCPVEGAAHDCNQGCLYDHGSLYGFCVNNTLFPDDYNCYCGPIVETNVANPKSGQCLDESNKKYEIACQISCQCSHGTLEGRCNYTRRSCDCIGQVDNPHTPDNNGICKLKTIGEFLAFLEGLKLPGWPRA